MHVSCIRLGSGWMDRTVGFCRTVSQGRPADFALLNELAAYILSVGEAAGEVRGRWHRLGRVVAGLILGEPPCVRGLDWSWQQAYFLATLIDQGNGRDPYIVW